MPTTLKFRLNAGLIAWLGWCVLTRPLPLEAEWGQLLVLFGPLLVVPLAVSLLRRSGTPLSDTFFEKFDAWQLPGALLLVLAYCVQPGGLAGTLSLPWLGVTAWVAWHGAVSVFYQKHTMGTFGKAVGMVYLLVGGVWALFDRMGWQPLGYDREIVLLTVAHFHYAGFVLPIVAGLAADLVGKWYGKMAVIGIVAGVPLVALGIVVSQLGGGPQVEAFAAWWLVLSALLLAGIHLRLAMQMGDFYLPKANLLWALAGTALLGGMVLAGLYGMRHIWAVPGLDIAWMRALHGSANVFGFSLLALLGWWFHFGQAK